MCMNGLRDEEAKAWSAHHAMVDYANECIAVTSGRVLLVPKMYQVAGYSGLAVLTLVHKPSRRAGLASTSNATSDVGVYFASRTLLSLAARASDRPEDDGVMWGHKDTVVVNRSVPLFLEEAVVWGTVAVIGHPPQPVELFSRPSPFTMVGRSSAPRPAVPYGLPSADAIARSPAHAPHGPRYGYVTLLYAMSYYPGVIALLETLKQVGSDSIDFVIISSIPVPPRLYILQQHYPQVVIKPCRALPFSHSSFLHRFTSGRAVLPRSRRCVTRPCNTVGATRSALQSCSAGGWSVLGVSQARYHICG